MATSRRQTIPNEGAGRIAAITHAPPGVDTLEAGTVVAPPGAVALPHHHGGQEFLLCVVGGRVQVRWGHHLEHTTLAGPGDCIRVPAWTPHQEMNASHEEPLRYVLIRDTQEPVVVPVDMARATPAADRAWADGQHPPSAR